MRGERTLARLNAIATRLRSLVRRDVVDAELDEELALHLQLEEEAQRRRGLPPAAARRAARTRFGSVESAKEACRDVLRLRWLENLAQDLGFGLRTLRGQPGYAAAAILTLGLGIGANTAVYSVVHATLLSQLPYAEGERLVRLEQRQPRRASDAIGFSVAELADYAASPALDAVVEYHSMTFTLLGGHEPERVRTGVVSARYFDVLGVRALHGRIFVAGEDQHGAEPVLLLSHRYWRKAFGGDPAVVGRRFEMNDRVHTVVGVLPPLPAWPDDNDVYMPISSCPFRSRPLMSTERTRRMMSAVARLRPGVRLEQAQAEVDGIAARLAAEYPAAYPADLGLEVELRPLGQELSRTARPTFLLLFATVGLLLLAACANVASLSLARVTTRQGELAVRATLGASRSRLLSQLATESVLLSLVGGLLGVALAAATRGLLVSFAARFSPRALDIGLDAPVLLFALALSLLTGLVFGVLPGLPAFERLAVALQEGAGRIDGGGRTARMRHGLVIAQLAVSFVLLVGASLMLRSLVALQRVDPGFRSDRVLTAGLALDWSRYLDWGRVNEGRPTDPSRLLAFYEPLLARLESLPGVRSAALAWTFPLNSTWRADGSFLLEGRPPAEGEPAPRADFRSVSPGYFQTLGIPLRSGRAFEARDGGANCEGRIASVIVSESLARRYWGQREPLGERLSIDGGESWQTIVGVAGGVRQYSLEEAPADEIYVPFLARPGAGSTVVVRSAGDPRVLERELRASVKALDPEAPVFDVRTLEQVRHEALASPRLTTALLGLFAALALAITATGVTGVLAYSVSQRSHEIGLRMALGAGQGRVLALVLRQAGGAAVLGLVLGGLGAIALSRLLGGMLFEVSPTDPLCFAGAAVVFAAVAAAAALLPARQAARVDPLVALRAQ